MKKKNFFFKNYFEGFLKNFSELSSPYNQKKLQNSANIVKNIKKRGKKILIFGNGGSSAICAHFASDIANIANIKCHNFSESTFITCFSNDYGYENWCKKSIEIFGDTGDLLILISASGESQNIINAYKAAKKKRFSNIISLTGFKKHNKLNKLSKKDTNFWVNSRHYNYIENIHQIILLSIVDYFKK